MTLTDEDKEKIRTYERYRRGEITEREVRDTLGDDVVEGMKAGIEAFRDAMELVTKDFLTDPER